MSSFVDVVAEQFEPLNKFNLSLCEILAKSVSDNFIQHSPVSQELESHVRGYLMGVLFGALLSGHKFLQNVMQVCYGIS